MQNLNCDKPIENAKEDLLGRDSFARHIANVIKHNCHSNKDSFVFALYGKWGEGKTSFINLLKPYLTKIKSDNQNKKSKNICIFDILLNGIIKIHIILFVWLFSFEEFFLKYDLFKNILTSTYSIDYNIYFFNIIFLMFKFLLIGLIAIKIPNIKLDSLIYHNKCCKTNVEDEIYIIDFSPWNMVDEKTLIENFLVRIQKAIFQTNQNIELDKHITKYMNAIIQKCSNGFINFDIFKEKDIFSTKEEIIKTLKKTNSKIIVFIDDIDRLEDKEICLIFKLVKSIANLPNISYFLSFDKNIVATALNEHHKENGNIYLEKIIQVPFHIPVIPADKLEEFTEKCIWDFICLFPNMEFEWKSKHQTNMKSYRIDGLYSLLINIRQVKRFINLLKMYYSTKIQDEVNIVDFIVITVIQITMPDLYQFIYENKVFLTSNFQYYSRSTNLEKEFKVPFENIINKYKFVDKHNLINILAILFPNFGELYEKHSAYKSAEIYRIEKNICSSFHFEKYFEVNIPNNEVSNKKMKEIITNSDNIEYLRKEINILIEEEKFKNFIYQLPDFIDDKLNDVNALTLLKVLLQIDDYSNVFSILNQKSDIYAYIRKCCFEIIKTIFKGNLPKEIDDVISNSKNIFIPMDFIDFIIRTKTDYITIDDEIIKKLCNIILDKIYKQAENDIEHSNNTLNNDNLINNYFLYDILFFWQKRGDAGILEKYLHYIFNNNEMFFKLLQNFKIHCSSSYLININSLYPNLDIETFEKKVKEISRDELSVIEEETIQLCLNVIKERKDIKTNHL